jgi:hypothetical protein
MLGSVEESEFGVYGSTSVSARRSICYDMPFPLREYEINKTKIGEFRSYLLLNIGRLVSVTWQVS